MRFVLSLLVVAASFPLRSEVIYDNSSRFLNSFFNERTEYGDQVDLEGTARRLRQILFEYYGRFVPNGDERVKVRLYANEKQYDRYRKAPATLLYESDWMPIEAGYNTQVIDGLNLQLPLHTVTVTAEFTGIAEEESAGLLFYDPPTVGYSFNEVWLRGATGLWVPVLYSTSDPMKRASVGLRLIADPEPLLDQFNVYSESQRAMRDGTNRVRFAQTFSPETSGRLSHVVLSMQFSNAPVRVRILDTIGGAPGPNVLGAVNLPRGTGAPQANHFIDQAIYLKAGTLYALELSTAAESGPTPSHFLPVSRNNYARGHLWIRNEDGGLWVPAGDNSGQPTYLDAKFEIHLIAAEPSSQLVSPRPRGTFDLAEPIVLEARHRPPEIGAIARVRFLSGTNEIASITNAPYVLAWTNATPGEHRLRAVAEDTFRRPFRSEVVEITVRNAGPPANDNFAQRLALFGTAVRSTKPAMGATLEPNEPRPRPDYSGRTLWWSWTAPDQSPVTLSAQNSSVPDASIAVFRGGATNLVLITNGVPQVQFEPEAGVTYAIAVEPRASAEFVTLDVAVADVRVQTIWPPIGHPGDVGEVILTPPATRSITNVQVFAGTELLASTNSPDSRIRVHFANNGVFNVTLVATDTRGIQTTSPAYRYTVRPLNDAFAQRGHLHGYSLNGTFYPGGGTLEPGEPAPENPDGMDLGSSAWWTWTAPATGLAHLEVRPENARVALEVFTGSELAGLTLLGRSTNGASFEFEAEEEHLYHIRVTASGTDNAESQLSISMRGPRLIRPVNNQIFMETTPIRLEGAWSGQAVAPELEFLANDTVISNLTTRGGAVFWTNAAPGTYELRARSKEDPSLVSGPVLVTVVTNRAVFDNRIFAGPFSRTSFVLNESGEVLVFGARPMNVRPFEHQDTFHPARALAFGNANGWDSIEANSGAWLGLEKNGALLHLGDEPIFVEHTDGWSQVSVGDITYAGLGADGRIYLEPYRIVPTPRGATRWSSVSASRHSILALADHGEAYLLDPQDGTVLGIIRHPPGVTNWVRTAAGAATALLQGDNGEVYSLNVAGPISSNSLMPSLQAKPTGVSAWADFAVGGQHQLFLAENGALFASGRNAEGQLGIGRFSQNEGIERVEFPPGVSRWTQIAAGEFHSLALGDDCRVYAWGSNAEGQLGVGRHVTKQNRPAAVESLGVLCPAPRLMSPVAILPGGDISLQFETILNRRTHIEYSEDLVTWRRVQEDIPGDGFEAGWIDAGAPVTIRHPRESAARFYRLVSE